MADLAELPGPERYHLLYTWDSGLGRSAAYLNGTPLRLPGAAFEPWWVAGAADRAQVPRGPLRVVDLETVPRYLPPEEVPAAVPEELFGRHRRLIGLEEPAVPIDVATPRGALLYESRMDRPASVGGLDCRGAAGHRLRGRAPADAFPRL